MTKPRSAPKAARKSHKGFQGHFPAPAHKMRSKVSSGRALFINGSPNSAWARRFANLVVGHVSDAGGRDMVSEGKFAIIKRASALECEIERLEAKLSNGEEVDLDVFGRACSHLRRLFEAVGMERRPKDITPDLNSYLDANYEPQD